MILESKEIFVPVQLLAIATFVALFLWPAPSSGNMGNWRGGKGGRLFTENESDLVVRNARIELRMEDGCISLDPTPIQKEFTWTTSPPNPVREITTRYRIFLPSGARVSSCTSGNNLQQATDWKAHVGYDVVATRSNPSLMMGFPIPIDDNGLDPDGQDFKPGIGNFALSVNGKPLDYEVQYVPRSDVQNHPLFAEHPKLAVVFFWRAPIEQGERYRIEVSYNFLSYQVGSDFTEQEIRSKTCWPSCEGFNGIEYYLSPISTWNQSPPELLAITIETGGLTPVHFSVSRLLHQVAAEDDLALRCIDRSTIHAQQIGRFPKADLNLNYGSQTLLDLTPDRWSKWIAALDRHSIRSDVPPAAAAESTTKESATRPPVPLTCAFIARLAAIAPPETVDLLRDTPCVEVCPE